MTRWIRHRNDPGKPPVATHGIPVHKPHDQECCPWPSRYGYRPSCAITPVGRSRSRARATRWPACSPTGFTFDSAQWLRVYRDVDDADEELLAVYHSHTATEAYPSRTDVLWAQHNEFAHWLLVSTRSDEDEVRSFTIAEGIVTEEPVDVV